jgi:putative membrane-bound dehydrogenase-like protein
MNRLIPTFTMAVLAFTSVAMTQPLEKNGPCGTLARTNVFNGQNLLAYNDGTANPKNFVTGAGWPIRPPTAMTNEGAIQVPLSPQAAINCVVVPPGLKAQLVASELTPGPTGARPLAYLMHFTFDERGRVWAVEPRDYPYQHEEGGNGLPNIPGWTGSTANGGHNNGLPTDRLTGKGRVIILEDTNGDGSLDNFKVFYEGLVLPTSIEVVKNGVIVTVPPNVYYIAKSTTNPDTAGAAPSIVVQNMGSTGQTYDTHGQTNSLARGIDNWIYVHNGYNGCGTPQVVGGNSVSCPGNGSIQRFKATVLGHDTNRIEQFGPSNSQNAHGTGFTEDGQWFKSHATVTVHSYHIVRPGVSVDIRSAVGGDASENGANNSRRRFFALTQDRYLWEGNNTNANNITAGTLTYTSTGASAVTGHDFYTARLLPEKYWNRFGFTCEGLSGLCNQDSLVENGSTWAAHRMYPPAKWPNIFASQDAWSAPLKVRTGPDGALWVLDWYNYMFLHNPASPMTNGAFRNPLRTKSHTRLYRIVPENGVTEPVLNLTNSTNRQLVNTLYHSNMVWRQQAQRLLIERGFNEEVGNLLDSVLTRTRKVDVTGIDGAVIHALWTLHGMKQFEINPTRWDPVLRQLMLHPAWSVRRNVVRALPATPASYESMRTQCIVNDTHAHVRIAALHELIRIPASGAVIESMDGLRSDTYLTAAYTAAGASKVGTATGSARPGTCPAYLDTTSYQVNIARGEGAPLRFRPDVRFNATAGGFDLVVNAQLPTGELVVHDLRGSIVFRSVWNNTTQSWSQARARNLAHPVYFYSFRATNGDNFSGRIPLTASNF